MPRKTQFLLLIALGLLGIALLLRNGDIAWLSIPFLAYLGVGIGQSPALGKISLRASRTLEVKRRDGDSVVNVSVTLQNDGREIPFFRLSDSFPLKSQLANPITHQLAALDKGGNSTLRYSFRSVRGSYSWKSVRMVVSDPFQLVETELVIPAAGEAQILPDVRKFRPFSIWSQNTLHAAGPIPARRSGSGSTLYGVREYHPGDSLQRLDWRLTARHPGQFFTKEFEKEEITDFALILDARQKTDVVMGEDSLFEHSVRATASLAELFLRQGNRVSLHIYGEPVVNLFPGYGKKQLHRILCTLAQTTRQPDFSLSSLQFLSLRMFSSHAFIFIISPLASDDWHIFPRLRSFGFQVLLISPDPLDYMKPAIPTDEESRIARRFVRMERQLEIGRIAQLWIPVVDWRVREPLLPLVSAALHRARVQRAR
jgi:uncharacterized protein (DUF58 family)